MIARSLRDQMSHFNLGSFLCFTGLGGLTSLRALNIFDVPSTTLLFRFQEDILHSYNDWIRVAFILLRQRGCQVNYQTSSATY
jgi:hypothetical protein